MTSAVRLALFGLFSWLLLVQVVVCAVGAHLGTEGRADFRQAYTAGYMVRSGHANEIYDQETETAFQEMVVGPGSSFPFDHAAYEALLYAPLSYFRFRTAYFIFFALNLLLLALATWLFKPYLAGLAVFAPWMPYAIFFCFVPVSLALILGQDSIILLTLMIGAFVSLKRGQEVRAGLLLGLGFFKFQYLIPIALLFFIWRKWRIVSGLLLSGSVVAGLSLWIVGLSAARALGRMLFVMSTSLSNNAERMKYGTFPDRMPNLRGLIYAIGQHFPVTQSKVAVLVVIASVLLIALATMMKPSFSLAVIVATLLSYHCLVHDSSLLIIPIGLVLAWSIPRGNIVATAIALTVFVIPAIVFQFWGGRYFVMTIPILALMWVGRFATDPFSVTDTSS